MAIDLENLRLDLPEEDFSRQDGVSRYWRFSTVLLLPALGALAWLHWFHQPHQRDHDRIPVRIRTVGFAAETLQSAFTAGGWVEPAWPAPTQVCPLVEGRIWSLKVVEGQDVEAHQTIALVEAAPYLAELEAARARLAIAQNRQAAAQAALERLEAGARGEEIAVAKAEVERAKAILARMEAGFRDEEIEVAQAHVRKARATASLMRSRANRFRALGDETIVARAKAEECEAEAIAAEESVNAAQHDLKRLVAGYREVDMAEARAAVIEAERRLDLLKAGTRVEVVVEARLAVAAARSMVDAEQAAVDIARRRVEWCDVKAPERGRVLEILTPQGGRITPDRPVLISMYDPEDMQVRVDIRQEQAALLFVGQKCSIKLEARKGQPYQGEVVRIDPLANLARDTVRAKVRIGRADASLRKDMTVTVDFAPRELTTATGEQALLLPKEAMLRRAGRTVVFVIRGGVACQTAVEVGEETPGGLVVKAGVVSGDMVAGSNLAMLADGAKVRDDEGEK